MFVSYALTAVSWTVSSPNSCLEAPMWLYVEMGPFVCNSDYRRSWEWGLHEGIRVPHKRKRHESVLCHVRAQQEGCPVQARKTALLRARPWRQPWSPTPGVQNRENITFYCWATQSAVLCYISWADWFTHLVIISYHMIGLLIEETVDKNISFKSNFL